jgi:hypothetical protein
MKNSICKKYASNLSSPLALLCYDIAEEDMLNSSETEVNLGVSCWDLPMM